MSMLRRDRHLDLLNDRVSPPILTRGVLTRRTGQFSRNLFMDTENPEEAFYEDDLTELEKGHIYLYKVIKDAGVYLFSPYRIFDSESAKLVHGLRSFRQHPPNLMPASCPTGSPRNKKMCLQNFSLSFADFETFKSRVTEKDGLVELDEVDIEKLLASIAKLLLVATSQIELAGLLRNGISDGEYPVDSDELLQAALDDYSNIRLNMSRMRESKVKIAKELGRLAEEDGARTNFILATSRMDEADSAIQSLQDMDLDRFEREAIHKYKVGTGKATEGRPSYIRSLGEEFVALSKYFSALKHLSVDGETIMVKLGSVSIVLSPDEVRIDGDIGTLKTYTTGIQVSDKPKITRRRRAIYSSEKPEDPPGEEQ